MKKILLFLTLFTGMTLTGCNDSFLEKYPVTSLTEENAFQSYDNFKAFMWPCYEMFSNTNIATSTTAIGRNSHYLGDVYAGYLEQRGASRQNKYAFQTVTNATSGNGWNFSSFIRRINIMLSHVDDSNMTEEEIAEAITRTGVRNVTLTGGEPLLQKDIRVLLERLAQEKSLAVEIETNGSMPIAPYQRMQHAPSMTMDYKLPFSGMEGKMCLDNLKELLPKDTVKFVCGSLEDLQKAEKIIDSYHLTEKCAVYLSPVFGAIEPADMVEYMKEHHMNGVNLQLQLHKFIWDPQERGV